MSPLSARVCGPWPAGEPAPPGLVPRLTILWIRQRRGRRRVWRTYRELEWRKPQLKQG